MRVLAGEYVAPIVEAVDSLSFDLAEINKDLGSVESRLEDFDYRIRKFEVRS